MQTQLTTLNKVLELFKPEIANALIAEIEGALDEATRMSAALDVAKEEIVSNKEIITNYQGQISELQELLRVAEEKIASLQSQIPPPPPPLPRWRIVLECDVERTYVAAEGESLPAQVPESGTGIITIERESAEKPAPIIVIREDYDSVAQPPVWNSSQAYPIEFTLVE